MKDNLVKILPYDDVNFRWISNHYDVHLKGTCIYNGKLHKFETINSEELDIKDINVNIFELNFVNKIKWLWRQWTFEKCVGYYWSYKKNKKQNGFYYRKPIWLYKILFKIYYKLR